MDPDDFRKWGKAMVDQVADYWSTIRDRQPMPDVKPGHVTKLLPDECPQQADSWPAIFSDIEPCILKTNTHWHHPHFFGYYPTAVSYPAIMGDILSGGLGTIGFTWQSSPPCTEVELVVLDWVAKMLRLPEQFLNSHPENGCGMIQGTASECSLVAMLAARAKALQACKDDNEKHQKMSKLVAYCSDQAHSSVERAALLSAVKIRLLPSNEAFALPADPLLAAIESDLAQGMEPFFLCATVGTTPSCAVDNLQELGPVCQKYKLWMHVDAAYGGGACICPEYRHFLDGVEFADSLNINAHKLLATNFDCALFWMRNGLEVKQAFLVDPLYLKHHHENDSLDMRHYQIPLGRRFRALKLWFTLRAFGVAGLQRHVRRPCQLAKQFEKLIDADSRFETVKPVTLGLVCFRLKESDEATEKLLKLLNEDRRIFLVPCRLREKFYLRLAIGPASTQSEDINFVWNVISELAGKAFDVK